MDRLLLRLSSYALLACLSACGGAAPTDTTTPVAVELPAISIPTVLQTSVATVVSGNIAVAKAPPPLADGDELWFIGPQNYKRVSTNLDRLLSVFEGMSCTTTQCQFTNGSSQTVKIDFGSFSLSAPFSDNQTGLSLSLTCVDINTALTGGTAYCARVWVNDTRYLIGQFTTRPTSTNKGAGWFIVGGGGSANQFGVIYDKSTATAASTSGPATIVEQFGRVPEVVFNLHMFITETNITGTSTVLVNYNHYSANDNDQDRSAPLHYTARWLDKWFGNITIDDGTTLETNACVTLEGVRTTGCSTTLTVPDLPAFLGAAAESDYTFPATSTFPSAPTF